MGQIIVMFIVIMAVINEEKPERWKTWNEKWGGEAWKRHLVRLGFAPNELGISWLILYELTEKLSIPREQK